MSRLDTTRSRSIARIGTLGRLLAFAAVVAILAGMVPARAAAQDAWAPPTKVWVEKTGHTISEPFLSVWREYGNLIGNPISEPMKRKFDLPQVETKTRTVQFFENAVLVQTLDDKRGERWSVQAATFGETMLEQDRAELTNTDTSGSCEGMESDECKLFKRTGHTVRWGMKDYWDDNMGEQLLGAPITEELKVKDGLTVQYFQRGVLTWNEDDGVVPMAIGNEIAKMEKVRTGARSQPEGVPAYEPDLFIEPVQEIEVLEVETDVDANVGGEVEVYTGPGPQQGGYKEIVVSVPSQYMWAYEDGQVVFESYVSTGTAEVPETTTIPGYWSIHTKYDVQTMEGTISSEYYRVEDVPWVMYYDNAANAIHGAYWHSNFGTPMSHGCVNLPVDLAGALYAWAEIGTPVTVLG